MKNHPRIPEKIAHEIQAVAESIGGAVGVYAYHREAGCLYSYRGQEVFYLASVFKVPIATQFLRWVDAGKVKLDQRIEVQKSDVLEDSAILDDRHFSYPGVSLSAENLLRLMMEYSDNTASDLILALAGGIPAVRRLIDELGLSQKLSLDLSVAESFAEGLAQFDAKNQPPYEKNSGTPESIVHFLLQLLNGELLSAKSTELLLEVMKRCKSGGGRIRAGLPKGTTVAHKTGTITGYCNDVGIIDLPESQGKLILAVFIKETSVSAAAAEAVVAKIAQLIFDWVSQFPAAFSEYRHEN